MRAIGCTPYAPDTRVHVHAQLTMIALRTVGLVAAPHKAVCCSPLPALGLVFEPDDMRIRCPSGKRRAIVAACAESLAAADEHLRVDRQPARRLLGRLCSISQVAPEIRAALVGGYRVCEAKWPGSSYDQPLRLRRGSPAHTAWRDLLVTAPLVLDAHEGVAMAPRRTFQSRVAAGTLTSVTDASGDDGMGGFAFLAGTPNTVFIMSESWPAPLLDALAAAASPLEAQLRRATDERAATPFPVPAAELATALLLPRLVSRVADVRRTFAVGDCAPAVAAIVAAHSSTPVMAELLAPVRRHAQCWLGVHVPREANQDADRLSHPHMLTDVVADAEAAHLCVVRVRPTEADWDELWAHVVQAHTRGVRRSAKRRRAAAQPLAD